MGKGRDKRKVAKQKREAIRKIAAKVTKWANEK